MTSVYKSSANRDRLCAFFHSPLIYDYVSLWGGKDNDRMIMDTSAMSQNKTQPHNKLKRSQLNKMKQKQKRSAKRIAK